MPGSEKIQVLIVDDIADTRENIRRLLQFETSIETIGMAATGREAITLCASKKPDVVLMDINMPDMDGIAATEAIRKTSPFVQVVILSVQNDPNYMRRAMLAGARDFLTKPPMIDELTAAIRRAGEMAHEEKAKAAQTYSSVSPGGLSNNLVSQSAVGKVVVVYSPKGGAGCTTIATNLALAFTSETTRTVLVDANMQFGDVPVFVNEHVRADLSDLTPRVDELDPEVVENVLITCKGTGLKVLAAPPKPELADRVNGEQFGKLLGYLAHMFDYIIVDTSSYLSDSVQTALDVADLILLVTTQDIPAIKNCNLFLGLADVSGIKRDRIMFLMNRFDKRIGISSERVAESLHQPIALAIPWEEKIVSNSINRGIPFVQENKTYPISKMILSLADLVREQIQRQEEPKPEAVGRR